MYVSVIYSVVVYILLLLTVFGCSLVRFLAKCAVAMQLLAVVVVCRLSSFICDASVL